MTSSPNIFQHLSNFFTQLGTELSLGIPLSQPQIWDPWCWTCAGPCPISNHWTCCSCPRIFCFYPLFVILWLGWKKEQQDSSSWWIMFIQISHHPPKRQDFRLAKHQMTVKVVDFFHLNMCIHGIISRIHPRFLENVYLDKYNYIDTYTYVYIYIYILVCMFFGGEGSHPHTTRPQRLSGEATRCTAKEALQDPWMVRQWPTQTHWMTKLV